MQDISPKIIRSPVHKPKVILFDLGNTLVTSIADTPHNRLSERLGLTEKQAKKAGRLLMTVHASKAIELAEAHAYPPGQRPCENRVCGLASLGRTGVLSAGA
jgi:hypothetical protein